MFSRPRPIAAFALLVGAASCGGPGGSPSTTPRGTTISSSASPRASASATPSSAPVAGSSPEDAGEAQDAKDVPRALLFAGEWDPKRGHPDILAIDATGRRAFVSKPDIDHHAATIETVELGTRRVLDVWRNDAAHPVKGTGFARQAFQPLTGDRAGDLVRYAAIAAHAEERKMKEPSFSVSRDGSRMAYLVITPPIMQVVVADAEGKNERRIGTPRMRGRDASLSPDGRWVAFSACAPDASSNDCARSLHVADLQSAQATPRKVNVAFPAERPAWDADSRGLWTRRMIARERAVLHTDMRRSCLQHVDVESGRVEDLVCAEDAADTDFAISPDRKTAVFVTQDGPPEQANSLRVCDLATRRCGEDEPIPMMVSEPLLTDDGHVVAASYLGAPWAMHVATSRHGTLSRSESKVAWDGWGARAASPHGFAWIALGSFAAKVEGGKDTPAFAIWGLEASDMIHAGPPVPR